MTKSRCPKGPQAEVGPRLSVKYTNKSTHWLNSEPAETGFDKTDTHSQAHRCLSCKVTQIPQIFKYWYGLWMVWYISNAFLVHIISNGLLTVVKVRCQFQCNLGCCMAEHEVMCMQAVSRFAKVINGLQRYLDRDRSWFHFNDTAYIQNAGVPRVQNLPIFWMYLPHFDGNGPNVGEHNTIKNQQG